MKVLIVGAGRMGKFFADVLNADHEVALFDTDLLKLRFTYNTYRFTKYDEVKDFEPELMINCVSLNNTIKAFNDILPYLPKTCIISDIASVKTGLQEFYASCGREFVSTHPMFGPTFAKLEDLSTQSAIIIKESCSKGKDFFRNLYLSLKLRVFDYTFEQHDQTTAYSLSVPFVSTMVFASATKHQDAPGTTYKRHMSIAEGFFSEDDFLITEVLFNPYTIERLNLMQDQLACIVKYVKEKDTLGLREYLNKLRTNIK